MMALFTQAAIQWEVGHGMDMGPWVIHTYTELSSPDDVITFLVHGVETNAGECRRRRRERRERTTVDKGQSQSEEEGMRG